MVKGGSPMKEKKGQVSIEFIILIGFVMILMTIVVVNFQKMVYEIQEDKEWTKTGELFNILETEIILADSAYENYNREFRIPYSLSGYSVNMTCMPGDQDINITFNNKEHIYFLNRTISGCESYVKPGKIRVQKTCSDSQSAVLKKCQTSFIAPS